MILSYYYLMCWLYLRILLMSTIITITNNPHMDENHAYSSLESFLLLPLGRFVLPKMASQNHPCMHGTTGEHSPFSARVTDGTNCPKGLGRQAPVCGEAVCPGEQKQNCGPFLWLAYRRPPLGQSISNTPTLQCTAMSTQS